MHLTFNLYVTTLIMYSRTTTWELTSQCMKIIKKCLTQIASEASYVYILSGQKFIKNAKK